MMMRIEKAEIDGRTWYRLDDVCRLLKVDEARAKRHVSGGHRIVRTVYGRRHTSKRECLIDAEAAEALAIRYGKRPRHEVMQALAEV